MSDVAVDPQWITFSVTEAGKEAWRKSVERGHTSGRMVNEIYAAMRGAEAAKANRS